MIHAPNYLSISKISIKEDFDLRSYDHKEKSEEIKFFNKKHVSLAAMKPMKLPRFHVKVVD
jgi:hypothetical protein